MKIGTIINSENLKKNLSENCIPESIINMTVKDYDEFLMERRKLMAAKIKAYKLSNLVHDL